MSDFPVKFIFGGAVFDPVNGNFGTVEETKALLQSLREEGIQVIDTAQVYGQSETLLGEADAVSSFAIDTKHCGGHIPGQSTKEKIVSRAEDSLARLRTNHVSATGNPYHGSSNALLLQVRIFYLHSPDRHANIKEILSGVNDLHKRGMFQKFGLSNFLAHEVEEVIRVAQENNFVHPSVYQGSYSAIARRQESELLPVLRKHHISFYAYSPLASGFLAKSRDDIASRNGRWDPRSALGQINLSMFDKPAMLQGLDAWISVSEKWEISKADLAYRWITYHSALDGRFGDAVVFGASKATQLKYTMKGVRDGPLCEGVVKEIDAIWDIVKDEAILDPVNEFVLKASNQ